MSRLLLVALAAVVLVAATPASSSPLDDAKRAGQVGEQADGYVGVVPGAPKSAQALVDRINAGRAEHYGEIAAREGTSPTAVAALAGQKLLARASPGEWIRDADGKWSQR
jgi:uncharacterized protein YdbL (DUF1318 family)